MKSQRLKIAASLIGAAIILAGCLTQKNLPKHNDKYPLAAAEYYLKKFSPKDSIGKPVDSLVNAENKDYTNLIDSLNNLVDSINMDWTAAVDSATTEAQELFKEKIEGQQKQIASLMQSIAKLKASYKPCKPDTLFRTNTVYKTDGALATAHEELKKAYTELSNENLKNEGLARTRLWMFIAACAVIVLLAVLFIETKY